MEQVNEFAQFWELYPRKVAKKDAETAWKRMTPEQKFAAIHALPIHVRYWNVSGTSKEYLPYPATWLNGERWTDELAMPESAARADWWKTTAGIEAKARELGVTPRAGEDWHSLKSRLLAAERAA